jgi:hypothetical protein
MLLNFRCIAAAMLYTPAATEKLAMKPQRPRGYTSLQ